jgi:hypothetical protein
MKVIQMDNIQMHQKAIWQAPDLKVIDVAEHTLGGGPNAIADAFHLS